MFSNDQDDGILGSMITSMRRKFSKIREKKLLKAAGNSSKVSPSSHIKDDLTADKVLNSNSKSNNNGNSKDPKSELIWEIQRGDGHFISSFFNGWVLERTSLKSNYRLRNPTTRRVLDLPDTEEKDPSYMSPIYIAGIKTFKMAFAFPNHEKGNLGLKVLTVGVDDKWRKVYFESTYRLTNAKWFAAFIGQVFVVLVLPKVGNNVQYSSSKHAVMIFFEAQSEKVWSIDVPTNFITNESNNVAIVSWAGKPALARKLENDLLYVWVVEYFKTQKWAQEKIMVDLTCLNDARRYYTPYYFYGNELWMHRDHESYLIFNIVSKVVTHIDAPKTPGKKFWSRPTSLLVDLKGTKPLKELN